MTVSWTATKGGRGKDGRGKWLEKGVEGGEGWNKCLRKCESGARIWERKEKGWK